MTVQPLEFVPPVIAHRGARARAPENTLAALKLAREEGVAWAEVDIKLTHDGVPILMHDEKLDRTTNAQGPVADALWPQVQQMDAGGWFDKRYAGEPVPQLSAALQTALNCGLRLNLEIKPCPGRARVTTMVTLMEAAKVWPLNQPPPLISSFDVDALLIAAQFHPTWPRGLLLDGWREDWLLLAKRTEVSALILNADILSRARITILAQSGLPVLAYTVNEPARAKELMDWGLRAVITDDPKTILAAL